MLLEENITFAGSILIKEGGFIVKTMEDEKDKIQAYQLRHKIFSEELKWVPKTDDRLEIDVYDNHAVFFGVFDLQNRLLAHMRLVLAENTFMIEREFLLLMGGAHTIRKEKDTAELSRCCITHEARSYIISNKYGRFDIFSFLFKGIYLWCLKNNIRYIYGITDHKVYKLLRIKGFPFKLVDEPRIMPDGVIAMAIIIDWREFEILNKTKRPERSIWFTQYQSDLVQWQLQLHEVYLQH